MRNLKRLSVAAVSALVLSGTVASAASATYDSEIEASSIRGRQVTEHVFNTDPGQVRCAVAVFTATTKGTLKEPGVYTSEELTVHPEYGEAAMKCKLFKAKTPGTISTEGCNLQFKKSTATEPAGTFHAPLELKCSAGKALVIKDAVGMGCEITIGEQSLGTVMMTNQELGPKPDVSWEFASTNIAYSWTKGCTGTAGKNTNGSYEGIIRAFGLNAKEQPVSTWVT
jgi:hypothetical protein